MRDFGRFGLSGGEVVFGATFTDGSFGVFETAAVPEPASLGLLGLGVAGILRRRKR